MKKAFMCFVALLTIAAAATGPARAQQQQAVVLTTITPTSLTTYNETTPGAVNVIFDGQLEYDNTDGWMAEYGDGYQGSVTVTAKPGFIIDSCKFYVYLYSYTVTAAPFAVYPYCEGSIQEVYSQPNAQGIDVGYGGVKRIDVYGSALPPQPHTVRLAAGTEEAAHWSLASGNAQVPGNQVLENVMSGSELTATYNGTQKVKSVKAVKYVPPAATVTTAPTATAALVEANSAAALVNAGAANGGTMMYAVTTTNAQPASTADFSASVPTAEGRTAGTYYVWYYAKADADHSDSEIAGPVSVTLPVITTVTWSSSNVFNSAHEDDMVDDYYTNPRTYEGVTISISGDNGSYFRAYDHMTQTGKLTCWGEDGDSFTFTAPSGKMFCKIEIIDDMSVACTNYGDWREVNDNFVWSGTAANAVTLGTVFTSASTLTSIVFKLIDAQ